MFSNLELSIIRDDVFSKLKDVEEEFRKPRRQIINIIDSILMGNTKPTETPIEELKEGQSVWCVESITNYKKGDKCSLKKVTDESVTVLLESGYYGYFDKIDFFDYFTTIPPTPTPKIDRAELISMVEHIGLYGTAKETVQMAVELLNEVNKVCNDIN
jgi:hypothetical protein